MHEFSRDKSIYENYVCPRCFHTMDKCTCECYPQYSICWIDKSIQEHVRILNQKGYSTDYSCESHDPSGIIYISFSNEYGFGEKIPLPQGFVRRSRSRSQFEHRYGKDSRARKKMSMEEFEAEKQLHLDILLEWCKGLPEQPSRNDRW